MPRGRGRGRRKAFKLKLKKKTIYTIFGIGFLLAGGSLLASLLNPSDTTSVITEQVSAMLGGSTLLFPFVLILIGFLFLNLKFYLSRINVAIGYALFFVSVVGLFRTGAVGDRIFLILEEIITTPGANLVLIAGMLVGIIVFFDTSIDEIFEGFGAVIGVLKKLVPFGLFSKNKNEKQPLINKNKPMMIKGGKDEEEKEKLDIKKPPIIHKKEQQELLPETLVSNVLGKDVSGVWEYPPLSLLSAEPGQKAERGDIKQIAQTIENTLQSFRIEARVAEVNLGPAVTQYALELALGTRISKITSLANNLALATEAPTGQIRIEAPIPGRNLVGIEIPNRSLEVVPLRTMLASTPMQKAKSKLTVSLGIDVSGNPIVIDIAKMPHMLVAGTTGSGKSVLINAFISTLLFRASPQEVRLILIDPKRVEFTGYNGIPHLLTPVIVEPEKILSALKWAMAEMDKRYRIFAERGVRNIDSYNELSGFQALPYIVIFIDELADLMMFAPVEVEDAIARLAQMARATGIHLVIATQRPSVNVITGLIKANIPCRIAFNVSSMIDSRVILDAPGAEKLLGRGDMLYIPPDQAKPTRIQGAYIEKEVKKLVDFLKSKDYPVEYTEEVISQPLPLKKGAGGSMDTGASSEVEEAIRVVCQFNTASASFLQRKMSIGYAKAARILDQLEEMGVVSHAEGSKPRDVLVRNAEEYLTSQQEKDS